MNTTTPQPNTDAATDSALLAQVVDAVRDAGSRLLASYYPGARPTSQADIRDALDRNEENSADLLRAALSTARPEANWVTDDQETGELPPGEWWAVDAVEGNINHVHGLPEWCVCVTLVRDNVPVLTAVHQPIGNLTYTALRGGGAFLGDRRLRVSAKSDLSVAIATTGQAEQGQVATYARIGASITAMLGQVMLVRATVPSTFPMLLVADGHADAFWLYEPALPGIAAGVLLITEAGGVVTDIDGKPWSPASTSVVAAAPALHDGVVDTLSRLS
jgi:myo-inositol-1(or 4)-monophosphatase